MKVAIVHDWLNTKQGGAEKVVTELAAMFPDAPIYTLLYEDSVWKNKLDADRIRTSYLQKFPGWFRKHPRFLLPFIPSAIEGFDFGDFDLVISSNTAYSHGIITNPNTVHICYCHAPARFLWEDHADYVKKAAKSKLMRMIVLRLTSRLRVWDRMSASRVDLWIANSFWTKYRIAKYYRDEAIVVYPPVDTKSFGVPTEKGDYFVTLSTLARYKNLELAIEAFNRLGDKLIVIGEGADRARLEKLAAPNVKFAGYLAEMALRETLAGAKGLIFPGEEDFGIAPVEAMAAGVPVIALNRGGLKETVVDGKTGILFNDATPDGLIAAVERLEKTELDPNVIKKHTQKFDRVNFARNIAKIVGNYAKK